MLPTDPFRVVKQTRWGLTHSHTLFSTICETIYFILYYLWYYLKGLSHKRTITIVKLYICTKGHVPWTTFGSFAREPSTARLQFYLLLSSYKPHRLIIKFTNFKYLSIVHWYNMVNNCGGEFRYYSFKRTLERNFLCKQLFTIWLWREPKSKISYCSIITRKMQLYARILQVFE